MLLFSIILFEDFVPEEGVYYRIVFRHSGKVIRPQGASTGNVVTEQWEINENDESQLWKFEYEGSGYYSALNKASEKVFDIQNRSPNDIVGLWTYHGGTNQQIKFVSSEGEYNYIFDRRNDNTLDVTGSSQSNGAGIISYPLHGAVITDKGGNTFTACPDQ